MVEANKGLSGEKSALQLTDAHVTDAKQNSNMAESVLSQGTKWRLSVSPSLEICMKKMDDSDRETWTSKNRQNSKRRLIPSSEED